MDNEWKPHTGGSCPVNPQAKVTVRTRGGTETTFDHARACVWEYGHPIWEIGGEAMPTACEIVEYREHTGGGDVPDEWGCDYCRNDGNLTEMMTCPECDAQYPDDTGGGDGAD